MNRQIEMKVHLKEYVLVLIFLHLPGYKGIIYRLVNGTSMACQGGLLGFPC